MEALATNGFEVEASRIQTVAPSRKTDIIPDFRLLRAWGPAMVNTRDHHSHISHRC